MIDLSCKLLIVGGGPGGYVCGIRAGQLGIETIVVEEAKAGGTCLNIGCIPSKALIHAADEFHKLAQYDGRSALGITAAGPSIDLARTVAWKDGIVARLTGGVEGLLKKAGARLISGRAEFLDGKTVQVTRDGEPIRITADTIVIATGSEPVELPFLPFGGTVISSTKALALDAVPERLVVVGGGYIGLEIGTAYAKLGASVTIVEAMAKILPQYDSALTKPVMTSLETLGIKVLLNTKAKAQSDTGLAVETDGEAIDLPSDRILVTVGRRPRASGAGIPGLDLDMSGPFIAIDETCRTSMRGVYAIGDVTGEPMLAHRAMAQGEMVAEIVSGRKRVWDKACIPAVCFTDPEIVTCGLSPDEAKSAGIEITTGQFPFTANGRAMSMEAEAGFVRVTARKDNGLILGLQGVGAGISELAAAFGIAIEMGARLDDIAAIVHAHPTLGEALHEACLKALGHSLHI